MRVVILAGGGPLPQLLKDKLTADHIDHLLIGFAGFVDPTTKADHIVKIGAATQILALLKEFKASHLVMVGPVKRPKLSEIGMDKTALKILGKGFTGLFKGDDNLLRRIADFIEAETGAKLAAVHDFLPNLMVKSGLFTNAKPTGEDQQAISLARQFLDEIGRFDIGQAAVVCGGQILAVEGAEGTDALIARAANLRPNSDSRLILVKQAKPQQDKRLDIPTIGLNTGELLVKHGYAGLALRAGGAICPDFDKLTAMLSTPTPPLFLLID